MSAKVDLLLICHPLVDSLLVPATCGAIADCLCILAASSLPCSRLAVTSSPLSPAIVIIASAVAAPQGRGWQRQSPSASWVIIPIGATATTNAVLPAAASTACLCRLRLDASIAADALAAPPLPAPVMTDPTAGQRRHDTVPRQWRHWRHWRRGRRLELECIRQC
jgi:hypothetical protein